MGLGRATPSADPLATMAAGFAAAGDAFEAPGWGWVVCGPDAAKAVLGNHDGRYVEHSDFFATARGPLAPRDVQTEIARHARLLLTAHLTQRAPELPGLVNRLLPSTRWPDAGNWLIHAHLRDAVLHPGRPARLRRLVDQAVQWAVLAGARQRRSRVSRAVFRARVLDALSEEIDARRRSAPGDATDLLDVVAEHAPAQAPAEQLAEVVLSFTFATTGSIGFLLGWCLHFLGQQPDQDIPPAWVVRESLRLAPIAWLFGRRPAVEHLIAGRPVGPGETVNVCTYLTHRHPGYWTDPDDFRPQRWGQAGPYPAYLPFGWGPHACTGAAVSTGLVEDVLGILRDGYRMAITASGGPAHVGSALAPPPFTLALTRREPATIEGGEQ